MKQIGFRNLGFALGVCSGPKGPVIDLPIFGEGLGAAPPQILKGSGIRRVLPICEGLEAASSRPNPCPFGDRPVHLEGSGALTFLVHLETVHLGAPTLVH